MLSSPTDFHLAVPSAPGVKIKRSNIEYYAAPMPNTSSAAYSRSLIAVVIAVLRFRQPLSQAAAPSCAAGGSWRGPPPPAGGVSSCGTGRRSTSRRTAPSSSSPARRRRRRGRRRRRSGGGGRTSPCDSDPRRWCGERSDRDCRRFCPPCHASAAAAAAREGRRVVVLRSCPWRGKRSWRCDISSWDAKCRSN